MAHVTNFSSSNCDHKTDQYCSNKSNSETLIRIVLFKECRFKERQLLFDSLSEKNIENDDTIKCSSTYLQRYSKTNDEFTQLTEMIFGSTAMRYHGTYFKVHNISSPERIVITQVFATPYKKRLKKSNSSFNKRKILNSFCHSNEWDINYEGNSIISLSDKYSNISLQSSISIFRINGCNSTVSHSSTMDSGFSEQYSSFNTISQVGSLANLDNFPSVSSKLDSSEIFDNNLVANTSDCYVNSSLGYNRLGLAIIISLATEKNKYQYFVMNHISFIESILWRIRKYIEYATSTSKCFLFQMFNITNESTQYLKYLSKELKFMDKFWNTCSLSENENNNICLPADVNQSSIFSKFRNILVGKFVVLQYKTLIDKFERSCRLIQKTDKKETNFFLSSLLSAVLSNYLGWIMTCYEANSNEEINTVRTSYNALWNKLIDLRGQTGKSKISKVIIYETNKELIDDTLHLLLYFIRYSCAQERELERDNIFDDNNVVRNILNNAYVSEQRNSEIKNSLKQKSLKKSKTFSSNLSKLASIEQYLDVVPEEESVIFILGDDEKLVDLRKQDNFMGIVGDMFHDKNNEFNVNSVQTMFSNCNDSGDTSIEHVGNYGKIRNVELKQEQRKQKMKIVKFPLPKTKVAKDYVKTKHYDFFLQTNAMERYEPDLILQGTVSPEQTWKSKLKNDLLFRHSYIADNNLEETVAILGDMNKWNVQLLSSNKESVLSTPANETVETSQLVADMLEVTQQMWKLGIPKQYCTTHIEQRLSEICLKSNAVAQLLLSSDFCTMDILLSTLGVTIGDIPLLMSVASSLCPKITKKYGLSYQ